MDEGDKVRAQLNALMAARNAVQDIDTYRQLSAMIFALQQRAAMLSSQPASTIPALSQPQINQLNALLQNLTTAVSNSANVAGILAAASALAKA
jgi:hypothetical protein